YNIDRGVVDKILENQADLMRQARIVPEQENGRVVGIRLYGVRQETLLGVLGMENGDRLQTINGYDMSSPEKALAAYARLRTADRLTISLARRGQSMNVDDVVKWFSGRIPGEGETRGEQPSHESRGRGGGGHGGAAPAGEGPRAHGPVVRPVRADDADRC